MRAAKLQSSMISRIAYDDDAQLLSIWFRDSARYCYFDVPRSVYDALRTAPSPGRTFNDLVKGRFRCSFDPERRRFRPAPDERHQGRFVRVGRG